MRCFSLAIALFIASTVAAADKAVLVIHGGAGAPEKINPQAERESRAVLEQALKAGHAALKSGSSLDAVEAAIRVMEDSPRFNAGKGAVFTRDGTNEMDAAIMEGTNRMAGAVAGVSRIKNPITAARAVMEKSEHVLLTGAGAERFAFKHGCAEVSPRYFWTQSRWNEMMKKAQKSETGAKAEPAGHFGTVGAVAIDSKGKISAGTSTGGMTYKMSGRLGDSPIIGAGTYADDRTCGVSGTGHGEVFIRFAVAYDIAARMRYQMLSVAESASQVFAELPKEDGGVGGVICLDRDGNVTTPYNTNGLFRGWITADGTTTVRIYDK